MENSSLLSSPNQTFVIVGSYDVTLTVTDNEGADSVCIQRITVFSNMSANCSDVKKLEFGGGRAVEFSLGPSSGNFVSHLWDFGDGNTSTEEEGIHTYIFQSEFTITLTLTDSFGNQVSCQKTINTSEG